MPTTSQQLIPIIQQGNEGQWVDARTLHKFLESNTRFNDWIARRIAEYGFVEGTDYYSNLSNRNATYTVTLDMAKELAMVERNEKGRYIRQWFIYKEKQLRAISYLPTTPEAFNGLRLFKLGGRELYVYFKVLEKYGYKQIGKSRQLTYPNHFILIGNVMYITKEFALHLYYQKHVFNNRVALKSMQPVLLLNEGGAQ